MKEKEPFGVSWRADKREWLGWFRTASNKRSFKVVPKEAARGPRDRVAALRWMKEHAPEAVAMNAEPRMRPKGRLLRDTFVEWHELRKADERTSPATVRGYADVFRNLVLKPFTLAPTRGLRNLADEDIVSLGTNFSLIRGWIRAVCKTHSAYRVRSAFWALRSFYADAIVENWFRGSNPMENDALVRELPSLPTQRERGGVVFLPIEIAQALLRSPKVPLMRRVRYVLEMTSGLREGEISGLTWGQLSLFTTHPHIEIDRARRLERAKDEILGPLKTSTSLRGLPLHPAAVQALTEWAGDLENGVTFYLGREHHPADPVFPSARPHDRGGFARPDIAEALREDLRAAGLPAVNERGKNFTAHALRKSFGTWLERTGADEVIRKRLMGHGAHDVTADYYTGENFGKLAAAVAGIELVWERGVSYEPPERPPSLQDQVLAYVRERPLDRPVDVAKALGIKRGTINSIFFYLRKRGLLPTLLPAQLPAATAPGVTSGHHWSRESGLNRRPALYETSRVTGSLMPGLDETASKEVPGAGQPSDAKQPSGVAPGARSGNGNSVRGALPGRATIVAGDVEVSTDVHAGEPSSHVVARLALALNQSGVPASSRGPGLHVRPRGVCGGG